MWFGGFRACEVLLDPSVLVLCLGVVGGSRCRIGDELLRGGCGCRFGWGILGDGVHWCGLGVWVCELWSSTGAQVRRASSGAGAASSWGWLGVGVVIVDPVSRVRWEWEVVENWFPDTDSTRWVVVGVLEFA